MLQYLRIKNLALLEEVSLDFESGFTAVTGETGAGKSILLGALALLSGARAEKTIIRQGASSCDVEAGLYFKDSKAINKKLLELDMPQCEDGLLILKRNLPRDKAPKITVNGSLSTLNTLQALGELWIDFHGPSEPRRLLRADCQRELLDLYARHGDVMMAYEERYRTWRGLLTERGILAGETQLSPDQLDFIQAQIARIDELNPSAEAIEKLERDFQRSSRAQELIELAQQLSEGIRGEEGLLKPLTQLVREGKQLASLDEGSLGLAGRLSSAAIELEDIASEFAALAHELVFDPEEAERVETNMETWLEFKRKYGDVSAVITARDEMARRVAMQGDLKGTLAKIDSEIQKMEKDLRNRAATITAARERAALALAKTASKVIIELGFKKADFKVKISRIPDLGLYGENEIEFLFSPNAGEPPLPLNKVASSGELARVMLALKTILADLDRVPVLVFDEVDANVGGEIGRVVGEKMAEIARAHQVLCVTHLPQVAAFAGNHLVVEKDQSGQRTFVTIKPIHEERSARVSELARMLGDRTAKSALAHATELLGNK